MKKRGSRDERQGEKDDTETGSHGEGEREGDEEMWRLKSVLFNAGFFCQADEVSN
jgi:hypothetical protein